MDTSRGDFAGCSKPAVLQTFTGQRVNLLDANPDTINIQDIAHALSNQCRYNGHCRVFYSVAQHCVIVSKIVPREVALEGLMHDAAEAYLGDMVRPLKMTDGIGELYRAAEANLEQVIARKFNLSFPWPAQIKHADNVVLFTEKRDIVVDKAAWSGEENFTPLRTSIMPMLPSYAEAAFMMRFWELTRDRQP